MKKREHYQEGRAWLDGWELERLSPFGWEIEPYPDLSDADDKFRIVPDSEGFLPFYPHSAALCPVDVDAECKYETDSPSWMASDNDECWEHGIRPFLYRPVQQKQERKEKCKILICSDGSIRYVGAVIPPYSDEVVKTIKVFDDGTTEEID